DRGGWNNPYLREAGYDTPSRLLVTPAGDGVTSLAQVIRHIEQRRPQLVLNRSKR
ncbi:MAG: hypothetical protein JNJ60_08715, partial [Rhodocyclaceae bacterium]|nr:hypothetical protein [Rhodocyclaceae bacterium]